MWKNDVLSETEWQVVIDNVFAPDEEWIALNTDGALTIEAGIQELINGALQSSQVEQTLPTEDSADDESKLISRRAAFGLVPKQWNQADAGKTLIIGNDGTLMPGKPALLAEGAATDDVIGTRALADEDADPTLVSVTAKKQLSWLQWMRNNLKWLLSARNLHKGDTNTAGILIDLGQETLITQEIIFNIIYNETNAGNLVRQASIHGQVYGGAGNRTGMVQNGNAPVDVFYFKGTPEGIGNTHSFLWIPNSAAARFPSAMAEAWFGQSTGNMSKMTVSVSTLAAAPAETLVPITPQAIANTWVDVPYTAEDGFDASGFRVKYNAALNIMRIHFEGNVVTTFSIGMRLFTVTLPKSISYTRRGFMSLGIYNSGGTQTGRNPSSIDVTTSGAINIYPKIYDQASGAVPAFNKCRLYGDVWFLWNKRR